MQKLITILFKVPELQRKILMTAMFLAIYRIGFYIPLPIVDQEKLRSWQDVQQLTSRARAGAEEMSREGAAIRFLRTIFVPEDQSCFFLYEGNSIEAISEAGRRAELHIVRIGETLQAEFGPGDKG